MSNKEKDCPLTISDWVNVLENYKSHIMSKTIPILQILIALLAIFISIIYLAKLRDNIVKNLSAGKITISMSYSITLTIILFLIVIIGILTLVFAYDYIKAIKPINALLKKIIDGEDNSNSIRKEWREKIEKKMESKKMLDTKKLKPILKHSLPVIGLITIIILFVALGIFIISENHKIIYALILQIIGVLLLSLWSLLERSIKAMKVIANFFNGIIKLEGNPWQQFDKMCRTSGLGFVMAGLIIELWVTVI